MSLAKSVRFKMEALEVVDGHFAEVKASRGVKGNYVGIYK
jgi:hypothetical protein